MATLNYDYLSREKYITAIMIAWCSALLSCLGSLSAIYLILRTNKLQELYHRLVFGLCISDLILSTSIILQPVLTRGDLGLALSMGNVQTCEFVGFLFQYYMASCAYNALLSLYFCAKIRYNKSDRILAKQYEPYVHLVALGLPTLFGIVGVQRDLFNPSYTLYVCDFWAYPADCSLHNDYDNERGDCQLVHLVGYAAMGIYGLLACVGVTATWVVCRTVQRQLRRMQSHSFDFTLDERHERRNGIVMRQAFLYTAAFLNGFIIVLLATVSTARVLERATVDPEVLGESRLYYAGVILCFFLFPLQGFFNWIIYVRRRLFHIRRLHPDRTWWWSYQRLFRPSKVFSSSMPMEIPNHSAHPSAAAASFDDGDDDGSISWDMDDSGMILFHSDCEVDTNATTIATIRQDAMATMLEPSKLHDNHPVNDNHDEESPCSDS